MLNRIFKNKSLKHIALYILTAMFAIFVAEYFIIRHKIEGLKEVEEKKDYARSAQISSQQIALHVHNFLDGKEDLSAEIISAIENQDHLLEIIHIGGRMDRTDVFLKPLSRLPQISFEQLQEAWNKYKSNVLIVLMDPDGQPVADSFGNIAVTERMKAQKLLPAQWMTLSNWYSNLEVDLTHEAERKKGSVETFVFAFILADVLLFVLLYFLFRRFLIQSVETLRLNTIRQIQNKDVRHNEIGQLTTAVNDVLEQLKDATEFVGAIGEGRLDFDYKSLDANHAAGKNELADSLINMQSKLKEMNEAEKRRQWANEGLTKFVDILRSSNDNISQLSDKIIAALVKYTGSNQGGLFVLNDEQKGDHHLELISKFAFDVKKYEKQKIKLGEGLLGQTFLEKETTLLTDIPEEYIRITSGLGDATPKSLLMVPLKVDQQVYGIVELASLDIYEQHEIAFVEKLAETIASTLASVKTAQKNRQLIEQFQEQTEEMRAQEEEMRQNMEELQATQEELSRKETDYIRRIQKLESNVTDTENSNREIIDLKEELQGKERAYSQKIQELEQALSEKSLKPDDWKLAEELQQNFKIHLEAMKIANDEVIKKI